MNEGSTVTSLWTNRTAGEALFNNKLLYITCRPRRQGAARPNRLKVSNVGSKGRWINTVIFRPARWKGDKLRTFRTVALASRLSSLASRLSPLASRLSAFKSVLPRRGQHLHSPTAMFILTIIRLRRYFARGTCTQVSTLGLYNFCCSNQRVKPQW
jgi:hypothetical protein